MQQGRRVSRLCSDSFAGEHGVISLASQIKRVQAWTVRIFFACTVGFEIPMRDLWTTKCWAYAAVFLVALTGKLAAGLLATPLTPLNAATVRCGAMLC